MWTAKWILDDYDKGDQTVRWEMYMAYRDLRDYFDQIEVSGSRVIRKEKPAGRKIAESPRRPFRSRLAKAFGG